jgi:HEAT repeat protein
MFLMLVDFTREVGYRVLMRAKVVAPVMQKWGLSRAMGLVLIAAIASLNHAGQDASAAENPSPATDEVAVRKGLLSVKLRDAPMADVLLAIGAQAGFEVIIRGDLSAPVTSSFSDLPLDKGIRRLLDGNALIMVYAPSRGRARLRPLVKVIALGAGGDAAAGTIPVARTTPGDKTEASQETALNDDREHRLRAVQRLAIIPDAAASQDLALLLSQDEDPLIRQIAAIALGKIRGPGADLALTAALADEDSLVRERVVQALAKWGPKAVASLVKTLLQDPDAAVRRQAAVSLGRMSGKGALDALQAAQADPDYAVRQAVFFAIARLEND